MSKKRIESLDIATKNFIEAQEYISKHPMFAPLATHANIYRRDHNDNLCPETGWAIVTKDGSIHIHPKRRAETDEWIYVLAHCLLHLGFGHFKEKENKTYWNVACNVYVSKFLYDMKLGKRPEDIGFRVDIPVKTEEQLYEQFLERGIPEPLKYHGTAGRHSLDMVFFARESRYGWNRKINWEDCLGRGLTLAVSQAVKVAAGQADSLIDSHHQKITAAQKARDWFINHYPLLGALAAEFKIVEDPIICQRLEISIAAIDVIDREIYLNPSAGLSEEECKFVIAHELLHAGLRHHERCQGRDHDLWNVACDYVINHWLVEMHVGDFPQVGILLDEDMKGRSAESIYDQIVTDIRTYRKLHTLRGTGGGDILDKGRNKFWDPRDGTSVDDFCKNALQQGLIYHQELGRGFIPAGLVEEIKALGQPPIPWDVELAKWFDQHFSPTEKIRSYARVSRRQSLHPTLQDPSG
jgi:predicted metal-dependent peptidase